VSEIYDTIRVRHGTLPFLAGHLARLSAAARELGLTVPADLADRLRAHAASGDCVLRVTLAAPGEARITTRPVPAERLVRIVIARQVHQPYRLKLTDRAAFEAARADAAARGADEALLETADGYLAEGTITGVAFWRDALCLPDPALGILPSIGLHRLAALAEQAGSEVRRGRWRRAEWVGRPLVLVNAIRGVMEAETLEGEALPRDPRSADLAVRFWPSGGEPSIFRGS
jgi:branched-subunit amino acid aminotransferase/4-amino-4-deoxychorismate lyase